MPSHDDGRHSPGHPGGPDRPGHPPPPSPYHQLPDPPHALGGRGQPGHGPLEQSPQRRLTEGVSALIDRPAPP